MKLIAIYALREPDTGEIRYIGKATDAMARFKSHMRDARRRSTPVYVWINELAAAGKKPVRDVWRMVEPPKWEAAEREEIAARKSSRLLNVAPGGNEPACPVDVLRQNGRNSASVREKGVWYILRNMGEAAKAAADRGLAERADFFIGLQRLVRDSTGTKRQKFNELGLKKMGLMNG